MQYNCLIIDDEKLLAVALFLNGLGIVKCTFIVPVDFIMVAGSCLILFTFGVACLLSLKIKKITPGELLAGE